MSPQERQLPLFPLNTVLFPHASLPLQVFEKRYKLLVQQCLDTDSKFGVVLIRSGTEAGEPATPHSIGTVAHIIQVSRVEGDRMFVSAMGQQRFRIKEISQHHPFMAAEVELLDDEPEAPAPIAVVSAVRLAATRQIRLVLGLRGGWIREARLPSDAERLSYFVAGILHVDLPEKQSLLEQPTASKRLNEEINLLGRDAGALKQRVAQQLRQNFSRQ